MPPAGAPAELWLLLVSPLLGNAHARGAAELCSRSGVEPSAPVLAVWDRLDQTLLYDKNEIRVNYNYYWKHENGNMLLYCDLGVFCYMCGAAEI